MPPTASIPRFLLPQRGAIWRSRFSTPSSTSLTVRNASNKSAPKKNSKPPVLEKPAKFNPPSHGQRLRTAPVNYPGPQLSPENQAAQKKKQYPNMMPPEGSFFHWFLNNKSIHIYISLGTLFSLAATVWATNFKRNSPFSDMLPTWGHSFLHPFESGRIFWEVLKLTTDYNTAETVERRKRKIDDIGKRAQYRKAHGLDKNQGWGGWTLKDEGELNADGVSGEIRDEQSPVANETVADNRIGEVKDGQLLVADESFTQDVKRERRPVKKWFGIW